jgi:S1-C subfamily serine protease
MDDRLELQNLSAQLSSLGARAAPAVVAVQSHRALSSGFFWRDGLVVTADAALAEEGEVLVMLASGEQRAAAFAGRDPATDIALLRIAGGASAPVTLAGMPVQAGSLVLAIGADRGLPVAAFGAVAWSGPAWRSMRGGEIDARIELDLTLRRHAEGGIVLNAAGDAIGMAVYGPRQRVLVIPAPTIERVASLLAAHGRVAYGFIGLGLQTVALDQGARTAAMVMSVAPDGPGAVAGVQQGDVILSWDGEAISGVQQVLRALGPSKVGKTVHAGLRRGGQELDIRLTIGERP